MERLNGEIDGYTDWFDYITTDAATASQKMFSSESYYTTFWEHSLHALAIVSEEGRILEANPAFCQLIGIETHQATGINIRNLVADGEFREDMRMIDTMFLGQMVEGVTEERWNFRLDSHGPYIPVRLKAMRIPANRNRPFKHIIIQVYDLRSTKYDMQGKNWSNKKTGELAKELLMDDGLDHTSVCVVKPELVDLKHIERHARYVAVDATVTLYLGEVAYTLQQAVGDTGRSA